MVPTEKLRQLLSAHESDEYGADCATASALRELIAWRSVVAQFQEAYGEEFFAPLPADKVPQDGAAAHVGRIILSRIVKAVCEEATDAD